MTILFLAVRYLTPFGLVSSAFGRWPFDSPGFCGFWKEASPFSRLEHTSKCWSVTKAFRFRNTILGVNVYPCLIRKSQSYPLCSCSAYYESRFPTVITCVVLNRKFWNVFWIICLNTHTVAVCMWKLTLAVHHLAAIFSLPAVIRANDLAHIRLVWAVSSRPYFPFLPVGGDDNFYDNGKYIRR